MATPSATPVPIAPTDLSAPPSGLALRSASRKKAPPASTSRTVFVFEYDGTTWNETATLEASDAADDDNLGFSVTVLDDFIVSGAIGADISPATNQGAAYVFELVGGSWVEIAKLQTSNGLSSDDTGREVHVSGGQLLLNSRADKPLVGPNTGG